MKRLTTREDAFEALLKGASYDAPPEMVRMAKLARALEVHQPEMRPEFRLALRDRLSAQAARRRGDILKRAREWWIERNDAMRRSFRTVVAMGTALMVLLAGSIVMAAGERAIPGDDLYFAKRLHESLVLSVTRGDEPRGFLLASYSKRRLIEIQKLAQRGVTEEQLYIDTLDAMNSTTTQAHRLLVAVFKRTRRAYPLNEIDGLALAQVETLGALISRIPIGAQPAVRDSIQLATEIRHETQDLLLGCPCEEASPPAVPTQPLPESPTEGAQEAPSCVCEPQPSEKDGGKDTTPPEKEPSDGSKPPTGGMPTTPDPNTLPDIPGTPIDDDVEEIIEDIISPSPTPGAAVPTPGVEAPTETPGDVILPPLPSILPPLPELLGDASLPALVPGL